MKVACALFDLDGTLVDTTELILSSHEHTLGRHLRGGCPPRAAIVRTFGRSLRDTLREHAEADGAAEAAQVAERMLQTYRDYQLAHQDRWIRPIPGVKDALGALSARGLALGMVTSKSRAAARWALAKYGLDRILSVAVFHEDTERHKPDPAPLFEAARRCGVPAGTTAYVGDSIHDIAAGRAAGMKTVAALWGPFERADLERAGPDAFAATPADLLTLFD
jgi:pyrophosphatase PpaX